MKEWLKDHPLAAVFAFVTVCVLPMLLWRDPSPSNELRYLSIVEEALRDGHFFAFYNQCIPYTDKPPLFFWLLMFFRLFCSETCMWLPILFIALIPAFVTVAVMDHWLRLASLSKQPTPSSRPKQPTPSSRPKQPTPSSRPSAASVEISPLMRVCFATLLLAGLLFMIQTFFLRMDMLMTMFIVLALFTFWKMYTRKMPDHKHPTNHGFAGTPYVGHDGERRRDSKADRWLLPVYIFLALFTKGPVGFFAPMLIIIIFLALERQLRRLPEFLGWRQWLVMLVLFAGWILGAWIEGGREYVGSLLFHQTMDRAVNAFTHKQPFWWYIPTLLYAVLPYTLLMIPAVVYLYCRQKRPSLSENSNGAQLGVQACEHTDGHYYGSFVRLLLTAVAVTFVMLSAFSGKLAIYLTPILPFMAYLMPKFADITKGQAEHLKKWALLIPAGIFALAGICILVLSISTGTSPLAPLALRLTLATPYIFCTTILAIAAVLVLGGIVSIFVICRRGWPSGVIALGATLFLAVFAAGCTIEPLNEWTSYERVCREASSATDCDTYNTLFTHRPENMDVYLGTDVTDFGSDVESFLQSDHRGEALIIDWQRAGSQIPLREFLESREGVRVGPFTVYAL